MYLSVNETDHKNFYPTPLHLVMKMESKVKNWNAIKNVLEPSAGKGDIARIIKNKNEYRGRYDTPLDIDCIEIDPNLQHILRGEDLKIVHDDFLTYSAFKKYDLIIMNPPFDNADKHLLKALDMQKRGGQVVCLLNAETLLNPSTNTRKELIQKLTDLNAEIDFLEDAFSYDAERKTKVKTALVYVNIKEDRVLKDDSFIYNDLKKARIEKNHTDDPEEITHRLDFIGQIVEMYEFEVEGTLRLIREYESFRPYMLSGFPKTDDNGDPITDAFNSSSILTLCIGSGDRHYDQIVDVNKYLQVVRLKYWGALFANEEFTKNLTSNLVQEYREQIEKMADYDFTVFNIKSIQLEMSKNMVQGVEDTIMKLFDELSQKHSWLGETSNNIWLYNGWKTNKAHCINKKVIIPLNGYYDICYSWGRFKPTYKALDKLSDIEKVFNYLDGGISEEVDIKTALDTAEKEGRTKKIQLKYFTVTFYKKGTCHIEFTNLELLKKFNIFGGRGKNWLPPTYGKKSYNQMTEEEQEVVDSFEGAKEYNKVIEQQDYYLVENSSLIALPEAV